ncbi:hypothetical protein [uncultured Bacteroides sp.]|uniref:hypothetical protein n=1 Tax=uncultured Bacteroides sp. TaxID=162156 RepID=UPI002AAB904E|nr:hypothetical protein [uncultured Bacteroides sp.]
MKKIEITLNRIFKILIYSYIFIALNSCGKTTKTTNKAVKVILIGTYDKKNNKHLYHADSIVIEYKHVDSVTQNIDYVNYISNMAPIKINYRIKKLNDLIIVACSISDTINTQEYINLKGKRTKFNFFPQMYMKGGFRFVRKECVIYKNKIDTLIVLFGKDVGVQFTDSNYYYLNTDFHLRRISTSDGKILFYDRNWL